MALRPRSIAVRLTIWYALTAFLLVSAVAWGQYRLLVREFHADDDQLLTETLAAAQRTNMARLSEPQSPGNPGSPFVRVLDSRCRVIAGTASPDVPLPECAGGPERRFRNATTRDGHPWRMVSQAVGVSTSRPSAAWIEVALDRTTDLDALATHRRSLGSALLAVLLVSTVLGYLLARRGLAPLETLALAVSRIQARSLARTLDVSEAPTEVRTLVASFDGMRERLNAAFASLTQFSTELAHELRTPLHVLRQQTEVALARARTPEEYREVLISSLEELDRLHHMVDDILFLARAEDPRSRIERTELRVADELTDVADYLEPLAAERGVALVTDAPLPLRVSADRMLLRRALVNLVSNAIRHTPRGGRVSLEATTRDTLLAIQVRDTGAGIPASALPHIFDRYYRVPGSDTGTGEGTGLGLAIVKGITALHGGWATVTSALGEGTNVTLIFPMREPEQDARKLTEIRQPQQEKFNTE